LSVNIATSHKSTLHILPWTLAPKTLRARIFLALAVVGATSLLESALGDILSEDNDMLLHLGAILLCALHLGRTPARGACVASVLVLSLGQVHSGFAIHGGSLQYLCSFALFAVITEQVARLAEKTRLNAWRAEDRCETVALSSDFRRRCSEATSRQEVEDLLKTLDWVDDAPLVAELRLSAALASQRLLQAELRVVEASRRVQSAVLNSMSHDLQTPLSSILGVFEVLQSEQLPPEDQLRILLNLGYAETERLLGLVRNLLHVSSVDADALQPMWSTVDLHEQAIVVSRQFSRAEMARIQVHNSGSLCEVSADPSLLNLVIYNLIENALKFSPSVAPVVVDVNNDSEHVWLSVTDEGCGVVAAEVTRIFDRFYRGTTPHNVPGSGLGLYICKVFAELHRGSIDCSPRQGNGSVFRLQIPRSGGTRNE
jgi:K+-sensing histidine kinase KdpD